MSYSEGRFWQPDVTVAAIIGEVLRRGEVIARDLAAISSRGYAFQVELTYRALRKGRELWQGHR